MRYYAAVLIGSLYFICKIAYWLIVKLIYSPKNCVWSGNVTSISPLPSFKTH
jgi:hypothetical protein